MTIANARAPTWLCYAAMLFLGVGLALIGAAARSIGLDARQIGLLISAQHLGFVVTVVIAGALADRVAKSKLLTVGSVALGLAFLAFYRLDSFALNIGVMILSGVGVGLYEGATDALLLDLHDCNQSRYVSLNHMFVTVGSALIAVFLLVLRDHWRPAVTAAGVATLTLGWFFHRAAPPPCPRPDAPFWPQLRAMPNKGLLAALFAVMTLAVGVELGTLGYLDSFLAGARGFSAAGAKLGLLLFLGGIATGRLAAGVLGGDARIVTALGTLLAMTTAAASALYFVAWRPAVLPLCFLIGLTVSATAPLLISLAGLLGGRCAGAAIGAIKVAIPFGGMALPFAVSQLASDPAVRTGWQYLPFPLASLGALAAAMALKSRLDKVARGGNAP